MNKIALITGANKGIGYETARLLGEQGMTVLIGARTEDAGLAAEKSLQELGIVARFVRLDVTDRETVERAARHIEEDFGHLDILINNAGITGTVRATPSGTDVDDMRAVYETNVFGVVTVTNAMLPLLRKASSPRIVNVSSEVGSIGLQMDPEGPMWQMSALPYPSSKTALNMITAQYAKELWDTGIKVNAANPGYTKTDLNHNTGFRAAAEGAEATVHLATLPDDGPSGVLYGYVWKAGSTETEYAILPW